MISFVSTLSPLPEPGYSGGLNAYSAKGMIFDGGNEMQEVYAQFLKYFGNEIKALMYKLDILEAKLKEFFKIKSYDLDTYAKGNSKIDIEAKLKEYIKIKFYYTYAENNEKLSVLEAELKEYFIGNETYTAGNDKLDVWVGKLVEYFKIKFHYTYATDNAKLSVLEGELRKYFKNLSDDNLVIICAKLKVYFKIISYDGDSTTNGNYKIDIEAKLKEYIKIKFYYTYSDDNAKLSVLEAELKEYFIGNETYTAGNDKLDVWVGKLVEYFKIKFHYTYATDNAKLSVLEGELREYFKNLSDDNLIIICAKLTVYFKIHKIYKRDTYANGNSKIDIAAKLQEYIKIKFYYTNAADNYKLSTLEAELKEYFIGNDTYATGNDKLDIWVGKLVKYFKIKFYHSYDTDIAKLSVLEGELREYFKNLSEINLIILCAKLKVYFKITSYDTYANGNTNSNDNDYDSYYYHEYLKLKKEIKDLQYAEDQVVYAKEGKMNVLVNKLNDLLAKYKLTKTYPSSSSYYKILTSTFETYDTIEKDLVEKMMYFDEKLLDFEDRIFYDERKLDEFYDEKKWRRGMNGLYNTR